MENERVQTFGRRVEFERIFGDPDESLRIHGYGRRSREERREETEMNRSRTEELVQVVGLYDFMWSEREEEKKRSRWKDENELVRELRRECIKVK